MARRCKPLIQVKLNYSELIDVSDKYHDVTINSEMY